MASQSVTISAHQKRLPAAAALTHIRHGLRQLQRKIRVDALKSRPFFWSIGAFHALQAVNPQIRLFRQSGAQLRNLRYLRRIAHRAHAIGNAARL